MKAPPFAYIRPRHLQQALELLSQHRDDARLLAGGQTLLATLNMRLSEPALLIDLQDLTALRELRVAGGVLRIGAMATHSAIEASAEVARVAPLLAQAAPHIAHRAIRNLGTFGGSIAFGDPAAEWPACLLALDGTVIACSARGERRIAAREFYTGLYTNALEADEMIVACELPCIATDGRHVFLELARRHGDYAVVGVAATARASADGLHAVRLGWLGCGQRPVRTPRTEQVLEGCRPDAATLKDAGAMLAEELEIEGDLTHTAATKRHLAGVMLGRAVRALVAGPSAASAATTPAFAS